MLHGIALLDYSLLDSLLAHRDGAVSFFFLEITQLGSALAILGIGATIALILALRHRWAEMTGLVVTLGSAALASTAIKHAVARPRPNMAYAVYQESGYSFPSEHTALTTALCIFVVYLVYRLTRNSVARTIAISLGLILVAGVAFSRLYLGVHYASDVVGGIILGAIMAAVGILVERSFEHIRWRLRR